MGQYNTVRAGGIVFSYKFDPRAADPRGAEELSVRHCHDTYELLFVSEGRGRYMIEGAQFPLKERTLLLIRPFVYHCVEVDADWEYERCVINFSADILPQDIAARLAAFAQESGGNGRFYPPDLFPQAAISVFDRFEAASAMPEEERGIYMRLLLSELLLLLSLSSSQRIIHNEGELGARVIRYINDNLDADITLDRLARRFFVSKYYLCRSFKKYSGISIHNYVNLKRVTYAKQLIESGETASGAAYRVGFGDYSAFYRAYVKIIGRPPTARDSDGEEDFDNGGLRI